MQESEPLNSPQGDLAETFGRLKPVPPALSARDVWYQAGLAAGRRPLIAWRACAAIAVAAAIALAVVRPPGSSRSDRIVYIPAKATSPAAIAANDQTHEAPSSAAYVRLRDALSQYGLSGLPPVSTGAGEGIPKPDAAEVEVSNRFSPGGWYPM